MRAGTHATHTRPARWRQRFYLGRRLARSLREPFMNGPAMGDTEALPVGSIGTRRIGVPRVRGEQGDGRSPKASAWRVQEDGRGRATARACGRRHAPPQRPRKRGPGSLRPQRRRPAPGPPTRRAHTRARARAHTHTAQHNIKHVRERRSTPPLSVSSVVPSSPPAQRARPVSLSPPIAALAAAQQPASAVACLRLPRAAVPCRRSRSRSILTRQPAPHMPRTFGAVRT